MRSYTVYDIFKRNADTRGNHTALVCNDQRITFSELLQQVNSLADGLKRQGIGKGDRIGIIAYNCHHFFRLFGAAAACGAIITAINWRLSAEEIQHILTDAAPKALCFDQTHESLVKQLAQRIGFAGRLFSFEDSSETGVPIQTLMQESVPSVVSDTASDDPFCIIYTAAVEGKSRGAMLTHANITTANLQTIATMGITAQDAHLNMLPLFHITGLNLAFSVMHAGGKNVIMNRFDAQKALEWVEKEHVSVIGSFPPILSNLQAEMDRHAYDVSSLRMILGIDQPDTIRAFEAKTQSVFWILYGQTETSGLVTFSPALEKPGSAGKPGLFIKMRIVNDQDLPVASGETGEIVVQGPLVFQGFWRQEDYTRNIFRSGWHHTGDLGRTDADGYLWFAGRKPEKELIKPGGENVYPAEVESVILEHPDVSAVSVIGVPDPKFGEGVKAVCVLKHGTSLTAEALKEFVASRIARYKKPGYVVFVAELPRTPSGAIDRIKVKALYG